MHALFVLEIVEPTDKFCNLWGQDYERNLNTYVVVVSVSSNSLGDVFIASSKLQPGLKVLLTT